MKPAKPKRLRETVAEHMTADFACFPSGAPLGVVLDPLSRTRPGAVELVCALDDRGAFAGAVPAARLFALERTARLAQAARGDFPFAAPGDDQEHAASAALHHGVDALPVLDAQRHVMGVLPSQALLHILRREHVEDIHRIAGIQRESSRARHAIEDPPLRRVRHRLPWLVAGLAGSGTATAVMASFHERLEANIAIAFFVPAIVYLADAVGTQSEAIAVRGLSLTRKGIAHLIAGELGVGTLIGAALGALALVPVYAGFGDARLALAVGAAIWLASSVAATLGIAFPWLLSRLGVDPAHGAGPVATVVQDILSIVAYFLVLNAFGI